MATNGTGRTTRSGLARTSASHTKFVNYSYDEPTKQEVYSAFTLHTPQPTPRDCISYVPITPEGTGYSPEQSYSPHCGDPFAGVTPRISPTSTTFDPFELDYTMSSSSSSSHFTSLSPFEPSGLHPGAFSAPLSDYGGALSDYSSLESMSHSTMWFECDLCGWVTEFEEHLSLHSRAHTGEIPFECLIGSCQATFRHSEDFLVHSNSHTYQTTFALSARDGKKRLRECDDSPARFHGIAPTSFTAYGEPMYEQEAPGQHWPSPCATSSLTSSSQGDSFTSESTRPVPRSASMGVARTLSYGIPTPPTQDRALQRSFSCDGGFSESNASGQYSFNIPTPTTPQKTFIIPSPTGGRPELVHNTFVLGASQTFAPSSLLASPIASVSIPSPGAARSNLSTRGGSSRPSTRSGVSHPYATATFAGSEGRFMTSDSKSPLSPFYCGSSGTGSPRPMSPFTPMSTSSGPLTTPPSTAHGSSRAGRPRSDSLRSIKSSGSEPTSSALLVTADGINRLLKDYSKRVVPAAIVAPTLIPITPISTASSSLSTPLLTPPRSEPSKVTGFASVSPRGRLTSTERIFPCEVDECGKTFKRMEHLKRHEKTHTKERPYGCDFEGCDKFFSRSDNLTQHKKTHESPEQSQEGVDADSKPRRKRKKPTPPSEEK